VKGRVLLRRRWEVVVRSRLSPGLRTLEMRRKVVPIVQQAQGRLQVEPRHLRVSGWMDGQG
jgi:hypothetical protein